MKFATSFLSGLIIVALLSVTNCSKQEDTPAEKCTEVTWYEDFDKDGLGNPNSTRMACDQPTNFVANADDIDDLNAENLSVPTSGYETPAAYAGMAMLWSDEFNDTELNEDYWSYQLGDGCPNLCGYGNNELQDYVKENTSFQDGKLIITAKREAGNANYSSTRINTQGKFAFKYGRIDVRASLPEGQGLWPAIWMLGENIDEVGWPKCGEIDIMEKIGGAGNENNVHGTVHWDNSGQHASYGGSKTLTTDLKDLFHVYSIIWTTETITWYIDDVKYNVIDTTPSGLSEFQEEFHFLINVAVGGNWPGSPNASTSFSQYLIVDYIRVFQ